MGKNCQSIQLLYIDFYWLDYFINFANIHGNIILYIYTLVEWDVHNAITPILLQLNLTITQVNMTWYCMQ